MNTNAWLCFVTESTGIPLARRGELNPPDVRMTGNEDLKTTKPVTMIGSEREVNASSSFLSLENVREKTEV